MYVYKKSLTVTGSPLNIFEGIMKCVISSCKKVAITIKKEQKISRTRLPTPNLIPLLFLGLTVFTRIFHKDLLQACYLLLLQE